MPKKPRITGVEVNAGTYTDLTSIIDIIGEGNTSRIGAAGQRYRVEEGEDCRH